MDGPKTVSSQGQVFCASLPERDVQDPDELHLRQVKHLPGRYVEATNPMNSMGVGRDFHIDAPLADQGEAPCENHKVTMVMTMV